MSGRFRLDPRAPAPPRAPPLAPAPPPGAPPAPRPAAPPAAPRAPAAPGRRRTLVLGALVAALLLVGGGIAVYVATAQTYPEKYVLKPSEYPPGLRTASLSASEREEIGIQSNPGEIDRERLRDEFGSDGGEDPERGHTLVLQESGGRGRVVVLVLKYASEEGAQSAAKEFRALCSFAGSAVLRDQEVLVAVVPDDGASRGSVRAVKDALLEKTDDLRQVCSA